MGMINVHEAKTTLSKLLDQLERGEIENITIARNGHPVAVLSPAPKVDASRRIGSARGLFIVPDDINRENAAIEVMFNGSKQ
jgi:antitoxin (DNA-binding transcriptional repressor) of toxin-antitoxin stability system